jgi:anti-sigma factor RsiW
LALLAAATAAGWWWCGDTQERTSDIVREFMHQARVAHATYAPEIRHPVDVTASEEEYLVTWLSSRLEAPLRVPLLTEAGYDLVGGRLLPAGEGPAAQFMYENPFGERLTLYVRSAGPDAQRTAFRYERRDGIGVFSWIDQPLGYAVSGGMERADLEGLARIVHDQLER